MTKLSHFDEHGNARMVDVGGKPTSQRLAVASAVVEMKPATLELIKNRNIQKGNVIELARVAGIMGSKKTADLIPLCHPISLNSVVIEFEFQSDRTIRITSTVTANDRTGVEMEALTTVATAALTIYDMCKSVDRAMKITDIQLEKKSGGKSGEFTRPALSGSEPHPLNDTRKETNL